MIRLMTLVLLLGTALSASSAIDAYPFPSDELQHRYDALIKELRCPQCLNTNLAGSDAMIARDLRREVHRLLLEGKSDREILNFMYERYGDFILYRPRVGINTIFLWFGPLVLLALAALIFIRLVRSGGEPAALEVAEKERLQRLLEGEDC